MSGGSWQKHEKLWVVEKKLNEPRVRDSVLHVVTIVAQCQWKWTKNVSGKWNCFASSAIFLSVDVEFINFYHPFTSLKMGKICSIIDQLKVAVFCSTFLTQLLACIYCLVAFSTLLVSWSAQKVINYFAIISRKTLNKLSIEFSLSFRNGLLALFLLYCCCNKRFTNYVATLNLMSGIRLKRCKKKTNGMSPIRGQVF